MKWERKAIVKIAEFEINQEFIASIKNTTKYNVYQELALYFNQDNI